MVGLVAHVIIVSPQSQLDLDFRFGLGLGLGRLDLGLGLDNNLKIAQHLQIFLCFVYRRVLNLIILMHFDGLRLSPGSLCVHTSAIKAISPRERTNMIFRRS